MIDEANGLHGSLRLALNVLLHSPLRKYRLIVIGLTKSGPLSIG